MSATDKRLARKPEALGFERAAAIPEAGLTARTMLRSAGYVAEKTVLVIGASGGLGLFTMQLAKAEGASVIATGKAEDAEYLRTLGADDVIDYGAGDTITQVGQRYPNGVHVVFDVVNSNDAQLRDAQILAPGGTLVSSLDGPDAAKFPAGITVHHIQMAAAPGDLQDLAECAAADLTDPAKHTRGKYVVSVLRD